MSNPNSGDDRPTIKVPPAGGGGRSSRSQRPAPYTPPPAETLYEGPPYNTDDGGDSGYTGTGVGYGPVLPSGFGDTGQGEADPTFYRPGPSYGGPAPDGTVLIRPNQKPLMAWLVVANGPYSGHLYTLSGRKEVIGREAADLVLGDPSVSAPHAAVWSQPGEDGSTAFFVQDLASANGTWVNEEEILKAQLKDGDRLVLGDTTLIFKQA